MKKTRNNGTYLAFSPLTALIHSDGQGAEPDGTRQTGWKDRLNTFRGGASIAVNEGYVMSVADPAVT